MAIIFIILHIQSVWW